MVMESKTASWPMELSEENKQYSEMLNEAAGKSIKIKSLKELQADGIKVETKYKNPNTGKVESEGKVIKIGGSFAQKPFVDAFFGTGKELKVKVLKKNKKQTVYTPADAGMTQKYAAGEDGKLVGMANGHIILSDWVKSE